LKHCLLRLATVTEIRKNTPLFQRLDVLNNHILDFARQFVQAISPASFVGEDNPEEDSRVAAPILAERVAEIQDIRTKLGPDAVDSLVEFLSMYECLADQHYLIMAFSGRGRPTVLV
jgi:hypothetical protein